MNNERWSKVILCVTFDIEGNWILKEGVKKLVEYPKTKTVLLRKIRTRKKKQNKSNRNEKRKSKEKRTKRKVNKEKNEKEQKKSERRTNLGIYLQESVVADTKPAYVHFFHFHEFLYKKGELHLCDKLVKIKRCRYIQKFDSVSEDSEFQICEDSIKGWDRTKRWVRVVQKELSLTM